MNILIESIGWTADILFVLAYFLVSRGKVSGNGKIFNFMNLFGALLYGSYALIRHAFPVFVLEIFWGGIAFTALIKIYQNLKNLKQRK